MLFSYKVDIPRNDFKKRFYLNDNYFDIVSIYFFLIRYELCNLWTDRWRHFNFPFNSDLWCDLVKRRRGLDHVLFGVCRNRKLCWDILRLLSIYLPAVLISELHIYEHLRHTKLCQDLTRYDNNLLIYSISFVFTSPHAF